MEARRVERKLAAILSADVKSYSRLMSENEEARAEAAEVLRINPTFSLEGLGRIMPFKDQAVLERYLAALRKAGLK